MMSHCFVIRGCSLPGLILSQLIWLGWEDFLSWFLGGGLTKETSLKEVQQVMGLGQVGESGLPTHGPNLSAVIVEGKSIFDVKD